MLDGVFQNYGKMVSRADTPEGHFCGVHALFVRGGGRRLMAPWIKNRPNLGGGSLNPIGRGVIMNLKEQEAWWCHSGC